MRDRFVLRLTSVSEFSMDKGMGLFEHRPWLFAQVYGISRLLMVELLHRAHELAEYHRVSPALHIGIHALFSIDRKHRLSLN